MSSPGWGSGRPPGEPRYWTDERVDAALRAFIASTEGMLPKDSAAYNVIKCGNLDLPTAARVVDRFRGIAHAWVQLGAPLSRCPLISCPWRAEEVEYLLTRAGEDRLPAIAAALHRTRAAVRRKLYDLGTRARDAQGYFSAQQLAREYGVAYRLVLAAVHDGRIPAHRPAHKRNILAIDPLPAAPVMRDLQRLQRSSRVTVRTPYRERFGRDFGGIFEIPSGCAPATLRSRVEAAARDEGIFVTTSWERDDTGQPQRLRWRRVARPRGGRRRQVERRAS